MISHNSNTCQLYLQQLWQQQQQLLVLLVVADHKVYRARAELALHNKDEGDNMWGNQQQQTQKHISQENKRNDNGYYDATTASMWQMDHTHLNKFELVIFVERLKRWTT